MEPLRVLQILHSMNRGGAENALMNYYRHIDRTKIQFDFLLTEQKKCLFEDEIVSMGGKVFRVPLPTPLRIMPYMVAVKSFFESHSEYRIVHSHTSSKSVLPLSMARYCGIPVRCSHSHSTGSVGGLKGLIRSALMPLLKFTATDYLACGNEAAIWLYGKRAYMRGNVLVFKNVIESLKFKYNETVRSEYRKQLGVEDDAILLGHTASFSEVKNHLFDIEILMSMKRRGKKVKLLLLGGGEQETAIKQKAYRLGVEEDVIFAGIVSNVYDYEQAMDIFLLPSFYEGLPLSIIEAQVSGLPCFTTEGKVSKECSVTDLVSYLPLEVGADIWAEKIIQACSRTRSSRYDEIVKAGYDAEISSGNLQAFYIKRYNETLI